MLPQPEGARNIALTLEYDGTHYAGSQFQQGPQTIQGELETAWQRLTQETIRWNFAGRTDAGVHARGQVANARTSTGRSLKTLQRGLNALLPPDIAVVEAREAEWSFHARFSAWRRDYRYVILNQPIRSPLLRSHALHIAEPLDDMAMHQAVELLLGEHDFASFGVATTGGSTVRRCLHAACRREQHNGCRLIIVELAASGFLRHMVRAVVGTLLLVGRGKLEPAGVGTILAGCDRGLAGPAAPAHGLYLESVSYQDNPPAHEAYGSEEQG